MGELRNVVLPQTVDVIFFRFQIPTARTAQLSSTIASCLPPPLPLPPGPHHPGTEPVPPPRYQLSSSTCTPTPRPTAATAATTTATPTGGFLCLSFAATRASQCFLRSGRQGGEPRVRPAPLGQRGDHSQVLRQSASQRRPCHAVPKAPRPGGENEGAAIRERFEAGSFPPANHVLHAKECRDRGLPVRGLSAGVCPPGS